jgi:hypothetical protein
LKGLGCSIGRALEWSGLDWTREQVRERRVCLLGCWMFRPIVIVWEHFLLLL